MSATTEAFGKMKKTTAVLRVIIIAFFLCPFLSYAETHDLPQSLANGVLSEPTPFSFSPAGFDASDFRAEWESEPVPGVSFYIGPKSFEWVRVAELLVIPRARLLVVGEEVEKGQLRNAGFTQPFVVSDGKARAELPIALISGDKNPVEIQVVRNGKLYTGRIVIRFNPNEPNKSKILFDPSCSPFNLKIQNSSIKPDSWMYVGCRLVYVEGAEHLTSSLEVFVFWDGVGQSILLDGMETPSASLSVWALRLRSEPGRFVLRSGNQEVTLNYSVPARMYWGSLGVGLGPYHYTFQGGDKNVSGSIIPLVTLYGSYLMTAANRLVFFSANALNSSFYTDFGVYFVTEQFKTMDRRLSLNLHLGAHMIGFNYKNSMLFKFSGPQGIEVIFRDFFKRRYNLSVGAFLYPPIQGRSYYNTWVRWGTAALFWEFNYMAWRESVSDASLFNRSYGLCVGFPLARFL